MQTAAVLRRLTAYPLLALLRPRAVKNPAAVFTEVWRRRSERRMRASIPATIAPDATKPLLTDG